MIKLTEKEGFLKQKQVLNGGHGPGLTIDVQGASVHERSSYIQARCINRQRVITIHVLSLSLLTHLVVVCMSFSSVFSNSTSVIHTHTHS